MPINYDDIMSLKSENIEISYTDKDSILYGLGVGLGNDPMNMDELKYVYENGQIALPSMATNFQYHSSLLMSANLNFIMVIAVIYRDRKITLTLLKIYVSIKLSQIVRKCAEIGEQV